jgi:NAD(P)H-dependent FMN reductase
VENAVQAKRLLCISGSYRSGGIMDGALDIAAEEATRRGWAVERVRLIEKHIEFCRNCRSCTQVTGGQRGVCPIEDDMAGLLEAVDRSDAVILASPTNFFEVTAVTRKFLERLVGVGYWPWGQYSPKWRDKSPVRRAVLMTSSAMPAIMARFFVRSMKSLRDMAKCLRGKVVDRVYLGPVALHATDPLSERGRRRVRRAMGRLLNGA